MAQNSRQTENSKSACLKTHIDPPLWDQTGDLFFNSENGARVYTVLSSGLGQPEPGAPIVSVIAIFRQ